MSDFQYWIIVVDDDASNLMLAGSTMSRNGMRVTALKSGKALLKYIETNEVPDLCLLDIKMPDMNGFETLEALRATEKGKDLPVIFLTASDSQMTEAKGLALGAMDFIRKPFMPEVLVLRARHIIDLVRLQKNLAHEVEIKTQEHRKLFLHVVSALSAAIDEGEIHTDGHSERVAGYAKEIARRYGYDEKKQNDMYIIGLVHDVGKIKVPENIKEHPLAGAEILAGIKEMLSLSSGARYHHERYDGTGYPDGLAGEKIPEHARIIAVADSYDAMVSRGELSQSEIRKEIEKGRGTQFDPKFADIMLKIIDESVN